MSLFTGFHQPNDEDDLVYPTFEGGPHLRNFKMEWNIDKRNDPNNGRIYWEGDCIYKYKCKAYNKDSKKEYNCECTCDCEPCENSLEVIEVKKMENVTKGEN